MAKKNTKKVNTRPDGLPAIELYRDVPLDNSSQHDCLVFDKHGQIFRFKSPSHNHIVEAGVDRVVNGFDKFSDLPSGELIGFHVLTFGAEPPAKQDLVMTALAAWKSLCAKAHDRRERPVAKDHETGEPKSGKLSARKYILVTADEADVKTYQELVCLRIIAQSVSEETHESQLVRSVREDVLRETIIRRADELKTKQDPWRIFQYYRPRLIEKRKIRLV